MHGSSSPSTRSSGSVSSPTEWSATASSGSPKQRSWSSSRRGNRTYRERVTSPPLAMTFPDRTVSEIVEETLCPPRPCVRIGLAVDLGQRPCEAGAETKRRGASTTETAMGGEGQPSALPGAGDRSDSSTEPRSPSFFPNEVWINLPAATSTPRPAQYLPTIGVSMSLTGSTRTFPPISTGTKR